MNHDRDAVDAAVAGAMRGLIDHVAGLADDVEGVEADANEKNVGEVYDDRNLLALAFARSVASNHGIEYVGYYEHDEWAVIVVELSKRGPLHKDGDPPKKPVSWHVRPEVIPEWLPERDPEAWYDGHDRDEKNGRLAQFTYRAADVAGWWA